MPHREGITALDPSDAKFMGLIERFSERLEWMKGDADQRNRQLEMQAATLNALEKGMSKMDGMISGMRDEVRATSALSYRVVDVEKRTTRIEDTATNLEVTVRGLSEFKTSILNKLAMIGLLSFLGGGGVSILTIKILFGGKL